MNMLGRYAGIATLLIVVAIGGVLAGVVPIPFLSTSAGRPACSQLPSSADVARAMQTHRAFIAEIEKTGSGVRVMNQSPCRGRDRALISITVGSAAERAAVDALLRDGDGFGVPAELIEK